MTVSEFEQRIFDLEGVRIVIRAPQGTQVADYDYKKSYSSGNSIREWLDGRVWDKIGDLDLVVVDGSGAIPNRKTHMSTLRSSYVHEE
jgi:hypothetical protein